MFTRCRTGFLAFLILATTGGPARSDGLIRDGIGPVSGGRGGTNIAHGDNGAIINDNPAGMLNIDSDMLFDASIDTLMTDLDYSDPLTSTNGKFKPVPNPEMALIRRSADGDFAAGIGFFVPAGFCAEYEMFNPHLGQSTYRSLGALAKISPGLAYRVTDDLSVGATLGLGISHLELDGPFYLQTGPLSGAPIDFDLQGTGVAPTFSAGLQYELTPETTVGVVYTEETRFRFDGEAEVSAVGLAPIPLYSSYKADFDKVWPRSAGIGIKHSLCDCQRVSADVIWYDWSHAFNRLDMRLYDASNPMFTAMLGPNVYDSVAMNWKDSVSLRLGYELFPNDQDTYRLGYVYHDSPVPDNTLNPYLDGVLEHAFSLGYGKRICDVQWDLAYQYSFGPTRHIDDSILAGDDFSNSSFKAQAHWLFAGVTFRR